MKKYMKQKSNVDYLLLCLILFRWMKNPFVRGFTTKDVILIVTLTYMIALLLSFGEFYFMHFQPYEGQLEYSYCELDLNGKLIFALQIKNALLISLVPLPTLITLHILSYGVIRKSTQRFNLNRNRIHTMRQVRKTFFAITISFFIVTVPAEIYVVFAYVCWNFYPDIKISSHWDRFFMLLLSLNSSINPFLYAKIHRVIRGEKHNQNKAVQLRLGALEHCHRLTKTVS